MEAEQPAAPTARDGFGRVLMAIAMIGGGVCVAAALLVTVSVVGRWLSGLSLGQALGFGSINGDFELVKMAVALSVFCFLPLTQWRRGNIMVDTFTSRLPERVARGIDAFWDFVYAGLAAVLAYTLSDGAREAYRSGKASMVLLLPEWPVLALCSGLLVVLALTALASGLKLLRALAR
jgi:TRAP-type C4-dicarboxylate transport system permease small subunit